MMGAIRPYVLRHELALAPAQRRESARIIGAGTRVWIVNAEDPLQSGLAAHLEQRGARTSDIPTGRASSVIREHVGHGVPTLIIDAGAGPRAGAASAWRAPFATTLAVLRAVHDEWAAVTDYGSLHYVALTWEDPASGWPADLHGLWAGLAKTLPREIAAVIPRVLSLDTIEGAAARILTAIEEFQWQELVLRADEAPQTLLPVPRRVPTPDDAPCSNFGSDSRPFPSAGRISSDDTVLITGGARGIGWELARTLAERVRCRVIVTGREDLDAAAQAPDAQWSEEEFVAATARAFTTERNGRSLPTVRAEQRRQSQTRDVLAHLAEARARSLPITYRQLDVTDSRAVAQLVSEYAHELTVVLHNAGIDLPSRIPQKDSDQAARVVAVKLDGFRSLLAALEGVNLTLMCLTGSLTGRYGGMVGQMDYAAANEALAYASRSAGRPYPVLCLAWPTWDGVGLITNLGAAAQYMKPISAEDGVEAWLAELACGRGGETAFMGDFAAVSCQHLASIPVPSGWAGARGILSRRHWMGQVEQIVPGKLIRTAHAMDPALSPHLASARVHGAPALPVSLILELLVQSLDGFQGLVPSAPSLENVHVDMSALMLDLPTSDSGGHPAPITLVRTAVLERGGEHVLRVEVTARRSTGAQRVATARLRLARNGAAWHARAQPPGTVYHVSAAFSRAQSAGATPYTWTEASVAGDRWSPHRVFGSAVPPVFSLPTPALEALCAQAACVGIGELRIDALRLPGGPERTRPQRRGKSVIRTIMSTPTGDTWHVENLRVQNPVHRGFDCGSEQVRAQ